MMRGARQEASCALCGRPFVLTADDREAVWNSLAGPFMRHDTDATPFEEVEELPPLIREHGNVVHDVDGADA
ncbi:hypothetical protein FM105_10595 [Brevibacterium yomogidense]|uniref:Uncharacterized protein n=1 Tax=Brevibacterium yomogidense TaxID=946573 RepID=A0A1X6XIW4_9MICO|nr:hypothetical protein FM105_10595 [Brevibacterium yomogidense]